MAKITFMGAGSTVFAKNILGDCMLRPSLRDSHIALYDINSTRLKDSKMMLDNLNKSINKSRAKITAHLGIRSRKTALKGADFVVNAIQVGGYDPCTITDFEIPKKFGLRQTIADTLGIGGIFRALRTIPVMWDFAKDIESVCPDALFINYTNPMSMLSGAMLKHTNVKTVGLCHSVQVCVPGILKRLGMNSYEKGAKFKIAGINHMAWLYELTHDGKDLYPEIKKRAAAMNRIARKKGAEKHWDMIRFEMMKHFGYYTTESSEHASEYYPYWIKTMYPEMIEEFKIPLDEYMGRCERLIEGWQKQRKELISNKNLTHKRSHEYGSVIMDAITTGKPARIHGNILNAGMIENLPAEAVVEVPCLIDRNGVQGVRVGKLPTQCAALNQTHINVHLMAIEAAATGKKEAIYHAAMLDPHTAAEMKLDDIRKMCDAMIKAHGDWLPKFK